MAFLVRQEQEKKNLRILQKYSKHFDVQAPYKVIVGPYFCQTVADRHVSLFDGISQLLLNRQCTVYTTRCCINELQQLVDKGQKKFIRGAHILRKLRLLPCKHDVDSQNHKQKQNQKQNQKQKQKQNISKTKTKGKAVVQQAKHRWNCVDPIVCLSSYMTIS